MKELVVQKEDKDVDLTLMIWDIVGREGYLALHAKTFVGAHGALLVADMTRKETFGTLERYWLPFLFKIVGHVPLVFVCNKSDLVGQCEFEPEDMTNLALRYNGRLARVLPAWLKPCYSTSAKTGSNVEKAFESLGHMVLSSKEIVDPVEELYKMIVATEVQRSSDKTTPVGALDTILADFCAGFEDSRLAMSILRQEIPRAGIDINNPVKEGILKVVEYIAEAENEFKDEKTVVTNLKRRIKLANGVKE